MAKLTLIITLLASITLCQIPQLNSASKKVVESYERLKSSPNDTVAQLNYLNSIPQNWKEFKSVFQPHDFGQLYPKYGMYLEPIDSIRVSYPNETGNLLINLAIGAKWEADATGEIQHILASFAVDNTVLFSKLLNKKSTSDRKSVIKYLADVENHDFYPEYQSIIDNLNLIKEIQLAKQFESARQLRKKQEH